MHNGLGVTLRFQVVSARQQLVTQFSVIVNLAVVDDDDGAILVEYRLVARVEVNDGEAAHRQADIPFHVIALAVGAAMRKRAVHGAQQRLVNRLAWVNDAADAAHCLLYFRRFVALRGVDLVA